MLIYMLLAIICSVLLMSYIVIRKNQKRTKSFFKQLKHVLTRTLFYNVE